LGYEPIFCAPFADDNETHRQLAQISGYFEQLLQVLRKPKVP